MSENTNTGARKAHRALLAYLGESRRAEGLDDFDVYAFVPDDPEYVEDGAMREVFTDLLTDLQHMARLFHIDWEECALAADDNAESEWETEEREAAEEGMTDLDDAYTVVTAPGKGRDAAWSAHELAQCNIPDNQVWTVVSGDNGGMYAVRGRAMVNHLNYNVTAEPWSVAEDDPAEYLAYGAYGRMTTYQDYMFAKGVANRGR